MKKIVLFLAIFIAGCTTYSTVPVKSIPTRYCAKGETDNCRPWTAGEIAGPGSRGHIEEPKEIP